MHTFQTYDLFRLSCFQQRKPAIRFGDTDAFTYYQFDEVDYFNYILFKSANYAETELEEVLKTYSDKGRSTVKFLFPSLIRASFSNLVEPETLHEITCLRLSQQNDLSYSKDRSLLTSVRSEADLLEYTRIYLRGFGSDNTQYQEVAKNFSLLWQQEAVDFFFVNHDGERVGICSNFYGPKAVFLSAGAVLPPFRNHGLHKRMIAERVRIGQEKGHTEFASWAYQGGISYQNLVKSQFTHYATYCEYVSKPLETITKAGSLLQS